MRTIEIQVKKLDNGDVKAFVEDNGKIIDSHLHGGEAHIPNDWGFRGHDGFSHKRDIYKHFGEEVLLKWKEYCVIVADPTIQYCHIEKPLKIVLDFVERWNKNDAEVEVAEAQYKLNELIK